jgi:hypothetical protein
MTSTAQLENRTLRDDRTNVRGHQKITGHAHDERRAICYVKETIMIAAVMLMSVALVGILCVVAYTLATYALPLMLGFAAAICLSHRLRRDRRELHRPHRRPRSACFRFCLPRCGLQSCVSS